MDNAEVWHPDVEQYEVFDAIEQTTLGSVHSIRRPVSIYYALSGGLFGFTMPMSKRPV